MPVQLGTDDPHASLEARDGTCWSPNRDHVITVDDAHAAYAYEAAAKIPMFSLRKRQWGGVDLAELRRRKENANAKPGN